MAASSASSDLQASTADLLAKIKSVAPRVGRCSGIIQEKWTNISAIFLRDHLEFLRWLLQEEVFNRPNGQVCALNLYLLVHVKDLSYLDTIAPTHCHLCQQAFGGDDARITTSVSAWNLSHAGSRDFSITVCAECDYGDLWMRFLRLKVDGLKTVNRLYGMWTRIVDRELRIVESHGYVSYLRERIDDLAADEERALLEDFWSLSSYQLSPRNLEVIIANFVLVAGLVGFGAFRWRSRLSHEEPTAAPKNLATWPLKALVGGYLVWAASYKARTLIQDLNQTPRERRLATIRRLLDHSDSIWTGNPNELVQFLPGADDL